MLRLTTLIPVYNTAPELLCEAVFSMLNQDIQEEHKIILCDDGSDSPKTVAMMQWLVKNFDVSILTVTHKNTATALNAGHEWVTTPFVAVMGSDDISHPSRLRLQMEHLDQHKEIDVLGANLGAFWNDDIFRLETFNTKHQYIPAPRQPNPFWYVNHGTVIYKQDAVVKVGGYDESIGRGQDINLFVRMKKEGAVIRNLQQKLLFWRRYRKKTV